MKVYNLYDQVAELLATLPEQKIMSLKPTKDMIERFETLSDKSKGSELSSQESDELNHFIFLERLIRLAKIKSSVAHG